MPSLVSECTEQAITPSPFSYLLDEGDTTKNIQTKFRPHVEQCLSLR